MRLISGLLFILTIIISNQEIYALRPPAVPLVVQDPYISIWSMSDNLYDSKTLHWDGSNSSLIGMISIDGNCYRFMGSDGNNNFYCPNEIKQIQLIVQATQTIYTFQIQNIILTVKFSTPSDMTNLDLLALPMTIISFNVENQDTNSHDISLYFDTSIEVTTNSNSEIVDWLQYQKNGINFQRMGTRLQQFSNGGRVSDRINWGFWYITTPQSEDSQITIAADQLCRLSFAKNQVIPPYDIRKPRAANDDNPVAVVIFNIGSLVNGQSVQKYVGISYDQLYGISYFNSLFIQKWKNQWSSIDNLMTHYMDQSVLNDLYKYLDAFDERIINDLKSSFNGTDYQQQKYANLGSLSYRQVTGSLQVVFNHVDNVTWVFMKEISSDGDVSTVDVIYPASPLILYLNPNLLYFLTLPLIEYANNDTSKYGKYTPYNYIWAPHHLGYWPICNITSQEQENMPIEETANMLVMISYLIQNNTNFAIQYQKYNNLITQWGQYLLTVLPDPGNQLCTDDFEGPSPHNLNLAAKGIVGLGAYSQILKVWNSTDSEYIFDMSKAYAAFWKTRGIDSDGKKYKLQYDLSSTWSQKYNLFFQYLLHLDLFNDAIIKQDIDYYLTQKMDYGIPLDNRALFTKADWSMWTAAMGNDQQFATIMQLVHDFVDVTPNRVPFSDWYFVQNARVQGFRARPVVGGVWAKVLQTQSQKQKQSMLIKKKIQ